MAHLWGIVPEECQKTCAAGFWHLSGFMDPQQQDAFAEAARSLKTVAPFVSPTMRDGTKMGVKVTSFGDRGWWADREGYRYIDKHPTTHKPFPPIPADIWAAAVQAVSAGAYYSRLVDPNWSIDRWGLTGSSEYYEHLDTCLVNFYAQGAELGWHVDRTERARQYPIVTFSIGATADFQIRLPGDGGSVTRQVTLRSGDAIVMAGISRTAEHRVVNVRADDGQNGLFDRRYYNPIEASGARLSFTVRRTGL